MPIPLLTERGLLPPGIHNCTLAEAREQFGGFHGSDHRPRLFQKLEAFVAEAKAAGIVRAIIINGSFVASKAAPNDIDILVVLPAGHDFRADLSPSQYNVVDRQGRHSLTVRYRTALRRTGADFHRAVFPPSQAHERRAPARHVDREQVLDGLERGAPFPGPACTIARIPFRACDARRAGDNARRLTQTNIMFSHVVIFWTKPEKPDSADALLAGMEKYLRPIPGALSFHIGQMVPSPRPVVEQSYQVALNLVFADKQAQDDYQVHPLHLEFVEKSFKPNCARAVVYDFA